MFLVYIGTYEVLRRLIDSFLEDEDCQREMFYVSVNYLY